MALRRRWCIEMAGILLALLALIQETSCKGYEFDVHGGSGNIASPNFPSSYPKNISCTWNITADAGHTINITIISLDIETSPDCLKDYIQIQLGGNESSMSKRRYCNLGPKTFLSKDGWAQIIFRSDDNGENSGFNLTWVATKTRLGNPSIIPAHITKSSTAQPCTDNGENDAYLTHETVIRSSCSSDIPQGSVLSATAAYHESSMYCNCSPWRNASQNSTRLYLSKILASKIKPSTLQTVLNTIATTYSEILTRNWSKRNLETVSQTNVGVVLVTSSANIVKLSLEISPTSQNFPFTTDVSATKMSSKNPTSLICSNEGSEMDRILSSLLVPFLALGAFFIGVAMIFGILLCRGTRVNRVTVTKN